MKKSLTSIFFLIFGSIAFTAFGCFIAFAAAVFVRCLIRAWKLGWLMFAVLFLAAGIGWSTPVLFTMQSLTGQNNNRTILVQPDRVQNPLVIGTNLIPIFDFNLQPVGGQVQTNLAPWGYTIKVDGWPRPAHIVVPSGTNVINAATLINTNAFAPLNIYFQSVGGGMTNVATSNTPSITFTGDGSPTNPIAATIGTVPVGNISGLGTAAKSNATDFASAPAFNSARSNTVAALTTTATNNITLTTTTNSDGSQSIVIRGFSNASLTNFVNALLIYNNVVTNNPLLLNLNGATGVAYAKTINAANFISDDPLAETSGSVTFSSFGNIIDFDFGGQVVTFSGFEVDANAFFSTTGYNGDGGGLTGLQTTALVGAVTNQINSVSGVITNGTVAWYFLRTNNTPAITATSGSICSTTNGQFYVRSNTVWLLK
jgi:hypothetical protein